MSSFFKKIQKGATSAIATVSSPIEITWLDEIVNHLLKDYDNFVAGFTSDGTPPNEQQAAEEEQKKFRELNEVYDHRSREKLGRGPRDEDDVIAVRKRILNRGFKAREGKLFQKFSGAVAALTEQAASTIRNAVDSLRDFEVTVRQSLPKRQEVIIQEIASLRASIADQVNTSFPDGTAGLDNYDDALPDGLPSWAGFQEQVNSVEAELLSANASATAAAIDSIRQAQAAETKERVDAAVRAAVDSIRAEIQAEEFEFLEDGVKAELIQSLLAAASEYEISRL